MPVVRPTEWEAISANEQLLWYLKRLCATTEHMSLVLGVASTGDPPMVTPLVVPTNTMTHASSVPVPDFSGSTIKAHEVLDVIHDARPVYIAMVRVTCSKECLTQVDTIDIINEIHDGATTAHLGYVVDLNDKEVEKPFYVRANTLSTTPLAIPRALASTTVF
ncbi:hypothetical protein D1007_09327 [Hordeum vulgare]|nr:hypothetical protein D1007_09327 [Hordeum vulgare]